MLLSALRRGAIRATAVITGGAALSEEYPVFTREEIAKRDGYSRSKEHFEETFS